MDIYPGKIVYSKAGRDKNRYFVIIDIIDSNYVYIADGNYRRIEKPKKKKIKHLKLTDLTADEIIEKLKSKRKITNTDLRKSLSQLNE